MTRSAARYARFAHFAGSSELRAAICTTFGAPAKLRMSVARNAKTVGAPSDGARNYSLLYTERPITDLARNHTRSLSLSLSVTLLHAHSESPTVALLARTSRAIGDNQAPKCKNRSPLASLFRRRRFCCRRTDEVRPHTRRGEPGECSLSLVARACQTEPTRIARQSTNNAPSVKKHCSRATVSPTEHTAACHPEVDRTTNDDAFAR